MRVQFPKGGFLLLRSKPVVEKRRRSRRGQTLVEYAMILALIATVCIAVFLQFGTQLKGLYTTINSQVTRATGGS